MQEEPKEPKKGKWHEWGNDAWPNAKELREKWEKRPTPEEFKAFQDQCGAILDRDYCPVPGDLNYNYVVEGEHVEAATPANGRAPMRFTYRLESKIEY